MLRLRFHGAVMVLLLLCSTTCREVPTSPEPTTGASTDPDTTASTLEEESMKAVLDGTSVDFGRPLPGLPPRLQARFELGRGEFEEEEAAAEGLGPVMNNVSCVACHDQGGTGGAGTGVETRFGRRNADGTFDPLERFGGSLIQAKGIVTGDCTQPAEKVPAEANVVAGRQTTALFGLGLLDAVPDRLLRALADPNDRNHDGISGRPNLVTNPMTGRFDVGRFGWKAQVPSLLVFSGDAYLNEMGITNSIFPKENPPQGGVPQCDDGLATDPEDEDADGDGVSDNVEGFADFMRYLAPPPRAGAPHEAVLRGSWLFVRTQCAACHLPSLVTGYVPGVAAMSFRPFYPFTDLLLHDMGSLGDGIEQGQAKGSEMRTPPLWGLRASAPYLHDGRAPTIQDAIEAHDGEAARARDAFLRLSPADRAALVAFLQFI